MKVDIVRDVDLSKLDHLFVLLPEGGGDVPASAKKYVDQAGFSGRSEETITILAAEKRKVTLIGIGKRESLTLRGLRAGIAAAGRTAKRHRDAKIALAFFGTV